MFFQVIAGGNNISSLTVSWKESYKFSKIQLHDMLDKQLTKIFFSEGTYQFFLGRLRLFLWDCSCMVISIILLPDSTYRILLSQANAITHKTLPLCYKFPPLLLNLFSIEYFCFILSLITGKTLLHNILGVQFEQETHKHYLFLLLVIWCV